MNVIAVAEVRRQIKRDVVRPVVDDDLVGTGQWRPLDYTIYCAGNRIVLQNIIPDGVASAINSDSHHRSSSKRKKELTPYFRQPRDRYQLHHCHNTDAQSP